jgi:hypothetical protein
MSSTSKMTIALLAQAVIFSTAYASEQSEAKGFIEDAQGSVLLRTGYLSRDKTNYRDNISGVEHQVKDTSSVAQTAIFNLDSGFSQGVVGFGVGVVGGASFKIGENKNAGNDMIPKNHDGSAYDHWARGGAYVKARYSNTTIRYGTQVLDLPVLASNTARLVPEYFTGVLLNSKEVDNLELIAGKFTKNQFSDQVVTDGRELDQAMVWGAKYKFNDQLNAAYYGLDITDKLERHFVSVNYKQLLANKGTLTYDFSGYHTDFESGSNTYAGPVLANQNKQNSILAASATYNQDSHHLMLAYQQNLGNVGYDYGANADGGQSIYLPNSYLSDFIGNHEKSAQIQYNYNFVDQGLGGLNWTTAFVYGWDIKINGVTDSAQEREFFNQVKYTAQSGFAKDTSLRVRHSYYRASDAYQAGNYIGDTNEWRIFLDIPINLF